MGTKKLISDSGYPEKIKNNLDKIYTAFANEIFSPKDIIGLLNVSQNTATNYIGRLLKLNIIIKVEGIGQSKYKFKN